MLSGRGRPFLRRLLAVLLLLAGLLAVVLAARGGRVVIESAWPAPPSR